jgi:hypothetical protein
MSNASNASARHPTGPITKITPVNVRITCNNTVLGTDGTTDTSLQAFTSEALLAWFKMNHADLVESYQTEPPFSYECMAFIKDTSERTACFIIEVTRPGYEGSFLAHGIIYAVRNQFKGEAA